MLFSFEISSAQHITSERGFEYKKSLLPYDNYYIIPLAEKQHVLLRQEKKNLMVLSRQDHCFLTHWEHEVEFDKSKSAPQIFLKGDSIITCSFTSDQKSKYIHTNFRYFSLESGLQLGDTNYEINSKLDQFRRAGISFSADYSHFVIYNLLDSLGNWKYLIYELGS